MIAPLFRKLPIRTREVFAGDSCREETETVFCPHHHAATAVESCKVCPFARAVENDVVVCVRGPLPSTEKFTLGHDPRVDVGEAAARTLLHEIVPSNVACVRADVSIEMATSLLIERGLRCLPVVDADDRLIGIVSKSDLLRDRVDGEPSPVKAPLERGFHLEQVSERMVSDIMTPCVHALPEDAPIAFAISLLAFESLHEVPVVSKDGQVLGVATALDILRWLAERMGYVLAPGASPLASVCAPAIEGSEGGPRRTAR